MLRVQPALARGAPTRAPPFNFMVSFDISSLFTNVPIREALDIIRARLEEDESQGERTPLSPGRVAELLQLCLRSTYFSFNG